jgi:hypothetical protein
VSDQPLLSYSHIANEFLNDIGVSTAWLIERYPVELKRFMLACDMGDTGIELPRAKPSEHILVPAANAWFHLVCAEYPQSVIAGIAVPQVMELRRIAKAINGDESGLKSLKWNNRESLHISMVQKMSMSLRLIPVDQQTESVRLAAVQQNGRALQVIPADQQSEALRLAAVQQDGWALQYIPADQQSEDVRLAAVQKNGWALEYIPT